MYLCYATAGGVGTSVVAATLALHLHRHSPTLLVDLCGDQLALLGAAEAVQPGITEWLCAAPDVGADALRGVEIPVSDGLAVLSLGSGSVDMDEDDPNSRATLLAHTLASSSRPVVIDAGRSATPLVEALAAVASERLYVTKACYLALARLRRSTLDATGVIIHVEPGRALGVDAVRQHCGAPVVARMKYDIAVSRAVDAGMLTTRMPATLRRVAKAVVR